MDWDDIGPSHESKWVWWLVKRLPCPCARCKMTIACLRRVCFKHMKTWGYGTIPSNERGYRPRIHKFWHKLMLCHIGAWFEGTIREGWKSKCDKKQSWAHFLVWVCTCGFSAASENIKRIYFFRVLHSTLCGPRDVIFAHQG